MPAPAPRPAAPIRLAPAPAHSAPPRRPLSALDRIPSLPVRTLDDLGALHLSDRVPLLPFLATGEVLLVHGPQGVGKTWLALTLARALAAGASFLKWRPAAPAGVLLIGGETGSAALRARFAALGGPPPAAPLHLFDPVTLMADSGAPFDLGDDDAHGLIYDYLAANEAVKVVIIDPVSALFPTTPEGQREAWLRKVTPFLTCLRGDRVATVLVHHSTRAGEARGVDARLDQVDTVLRLDRLRGATAIQGVSLALTFTKCRHAFGPELEPIAASLRPTPEGGAAWSWKPLEASNQDRLLNLAQQAEGKLTLNDAMAGLGIARTTAFEIRRRLIAAGDLADMPGFVPRAEAPDRPY